MNLALDTMRYNVSGPSLDTMDTYLASRVVTGASRMSQQAALLRAGSEAGDVPHLPTASKSPTASVGAAHGIGSNPIAGPLKAQAQPLQTTQLENMNKENGSEKPGPSAESPRTRDP